MRLVGVETGGEHIVVAVSEDGQIVSRWECPTTADSAATIAQVVAHVVAERAARGHIDAVGIASFGPIDPNPRSPTYGRVTTTPKPGWHMADVVGPFRTALGPDVPVGFDTDVNAAAVAELAPRAPLSNCCYITVGTGVGVGVIVEGNPVHGMLHPEAGHISVPRAPGDTFEGSCPFHSTCIEGMVASGALARRLGIPRERLRDVPDSDPIWQLVAHYLAQLCAVLVMTCSPMVIVLGGGIMKRRCLFPLVRQKLIESLAGYIKTAQLEPGTNLDNYVVPATYDSDTGVMGALELARMQTKPALR
jgi:fructokinase